MNKRFSCAMSLRRVACPQVTHQLWDAIKVIRMQRQIPNQDRITRYMSRVHGLSEEDVIVQLKFCVRDGLMKQIRRVGCKGSKIGVEQESYGLPIVPVDRDDYDWYCFECHKGGDVICCTSCYRVYHLGCVAVDDLQDEDIKNTFICVVCKKAEEIVDDTRMRKPVLNKLLRYICQRLVGRLPEKITARQVLSSSSYISLSNKDDPTNEDGTLVTDEDDGWRSDYLVYHPIDLKAIEAKTLANDYKTFYEFQVDVDTLVHNVVIYHGVDSGLSDIVHQMHRDCVYDIKEIQQCPDCYRYSNEKKNKNWFCQPCKPPHELVFAKQQTFPYWPAKVIKTEGAQYDVRFFGGDHERAVVPKNCIRAISDPLESLKVKRTAAWNKSYEELKVHQSLLEKEDGIAKESVYDFESSGDEKTHPESDIEEGELTLSNIKLSYKKRTSENLDVTVNDLDEGQGPLTKPKRSYKKRGTGRSLMGSDMTKSDTEEGETSQKPARRAYVRRNTISTMGSILPEVEDQSKEDVGNLPKKTKRAYKKRNSSVVSPVSDLKDKVASNEEESKPPPKKVKRTYKRSKTNVAPAPVDNVEDKEEESVLDLASMDDSSSDSFASTSKPTSLRNGLSQEDMVSSTCQEPSSCRSIAVQTHLADKSAAQKGVSKSALAKLRRDAKKEMEDALQEQKEQLVEAHNLEMKRLKADQKAKISEIKLKQWCYNCEKEAIYHCCWNTAYCSVQCQQDHWMSEHKPHCRRKRI